MTKSAQLIEDQKSELPHRTVLQRAAIRPSSERDVPAIVADVLRSPGHPLDAPTRHFMEERFGHDFSEVRVHTDAQAAESARLVSALAYTVGQHVVFGTGRYVPHSTQGHPLLAHELAHVMQQDTARTDAPLSIVPETHPAESHARTMAVSALQGHRVAPQTVAPGLLLRNSTAAAQTGPMSGIVLPPMKSVDDLWAEFDEHRSYGRDGEALATAETLVSAMMGDVALAHGTDLAVWLLQRGRSDLARKALSSVETAWWIRFVSSQGPGVPLTTVFARGSTNDPEVLRQQAESQALANQHEFARELFGLAFLMRQMQLITYSDERFRSLAKIPNLPSGEGLDMPMFRLMSYQSESGILAEMRRILRFYSLREREATRNGQAAEARRMADLNRLLRDRIKERYLLLGSGEGSRAITMEATQGVDRRRGIGYRLHGARGPEEFVTPLPGEPRPDELGRHPAYSASMEELLTDIGGQEDLMTELLSHVAIRRAFGNREIDLNDQSTRQRVWQVMYGVFDAEPAPGCTSALCSLLRMVERYLKHFTVHTGYNIDDFGGSYLNRDLPEDLAGRVVRDCGVYAVTVAYDVYRAVRPARLPVGFQLYHTLDHAMLAIFDQGRGEHYIVNNDHIIGPKTGNVESHVGQAYSEVTRHAFELSAGGRTGVLESSKLGESAFRNAIWQNYQTGARLSIEAEPPRAAGDTRTKAERENDTFKAYYEVQSLFDQVAGRAQTRIDQLVAALRRTPSSQHNTLATSALADLNRLGTGMAKMIDAIVQNPSIGLRPGRNVAMERVGFITTSSETGQHPIVRLGMALLYAERQGHTLVGEEQALLAWIRAAPFPSFGIALRDYDAAGRPPEF